ncbi:C45 family autoproteolytic acyltransferase/hydolase [Marixanthomonas ophiurae]|uniref:Acyl-CoA--6-aminopenicillanic acid acyl-transferase n=1 Tax=Marixanthomonas ophiurae TaxID=387659 RepID=A0A3E1QBW1_9FLAO|nr:C45 family peptidase [Marixanthomonas ophiurae]RFN59584.1 acyl-CoA--6-aminopenicillanic acid acyl-transferase [Marixanthomonas ophiurae]
MRSQTVSTYFFCLSFLLVLASCGVKKSLQDRSDISQYTADIPEREIINDSTYVAGNNFLTKNKHGQWELYVEGDPLEIGLLTGSLTRELLQKQERVFLQKVEELVPSKGKQKFLRKFLSWYNRKLYKHVTEEYKTEIYGVSRYASDEFNNIAPPYLRALYLHGAHDIGHALKDLMLVGCSSFAVWGEKSEDGNLLIARNFDFYAGDAFAEDKIIAFVKPDQGYPFMSVTWGGMMGVVSGMNNQGLTVTINAGKSDIPLVAKAPISLVTREILQYASTIDEAIEIAKKREVFVSEAIFVGSANNGKAAIIEVSPNDLGVYEVENTSELICSNHFQSETFANDRKNVKWIKESHSQYRFDRMEELLNEDQKINPTEAVAILRNKKGLDNIPLGYGNEKALNQLLAHHGIVFQPEDLTVWVSSNPYQLGEFVAYDLNKIFNENRRFSSQPISEENLTIAEDSFAVSQEFKDYEAYRILERRVEEALEEETEIGAAQLMKLQSLNPEYWKAYFLSGKYYYEHTQYEKALKAFTLAESKEITTVPDEEKVEKYLKRTKRKLR